MSFAYPAQKFQDWFTQQWVILWGRRIKPETVPWLMGPFGNLESIADSFVDRLAKEENLVVERNNATSGLIPSIKELKLSEGEYARLSNEIIDFYENTARYKLNFSVQWNPLFKVFGKLVMILFSNRMKQLNIPTSTPGKSDPINSEIITLRDPESGKVKHTIWYRTFVSTGQVLYSGIYTTCILPSGKTCIKAVFPLPRGNATVIMLPSVGPNGELRLDSSGKKFGDAGFYFLLHDSKGEVWSQYVGSFRDHLHVWSNNEKILAEQTLTLWRQRVVQFKYEIQRSQNN
jgi:hypothetical protein